MVELRLHGSTVDTVFDLLGRNENDMTFALGWGLARNDAILRRFAERVAIGAALKPPVVVELEEHDRAPSRVYKAGTVLSPAGLEAKYDARWGTYRIRLTRADIPKQRDLVVSFMTQAHGDSE